MENSVTRSYFFPFFFVILALAFLFVVPGAAAQKSKPAQPAEKPLTELEKNPELLPAFADLIEKLQRNLEFPPLRTQSRLLSLLPASTSFYLAIPNYGDVSHQALDLFHQQLQQSPALRDWWTRGELATKGPKIEEAFARFYELSQYIGDEIVITGEFESKDPKLLMVAEVRKPGFREALEKVVVPLDKGPKQSVRILKPEELVSLNDAKPSPGLLVLVRPDYVIASSNSATLRAFNATLRQPKSELAATPLGERIRHTYEGGVSTVGAADLQSLIARMPAPKQSTQQTLAMTGFDNVQYAVWNHTNVKGKALSRAELSFTGPRHGIASWLGSPSKLESLNFVSPDALMSLSLVLKDPSHIFDEIINLAYASNPNALASMAQSERSLGISLRDDLFAQLSGEITVSFDSISPEPAWRAVVKVRDAARFQQTLNTLLSSARLTVQQSQVGAITGQFVRIPSPRKETVIGFAFVDNYLVVGSSPDTLEQAVELHRTGESLGKSAKFLASLPPGGPEVSALWYQDPTAMATLQIQRLAPELAQSLSQLRGQGDPVIMCMYGDEAAIRMASTNQGFDVGTTMVVAAIAIPNLLRARIAANEASAVGSLRTINTAQVTYASAYPARGFARDLARLGPDPRGTKSYSPLHAGLLDESLANPACTANAGWCEKSGYRFQVVSACRKTCTEYVVAATPVSTSTGSKNFCSTSDGIVRTLPGPPLTTIPTATECRKWPALK